MGTAGEKKLFLFRMKSNKCFFLLIIGMLLLGSNVFSSIDLADELSITYYVPDDYPTIQQAIDVAEDGTYVYYTAETPGLSTFAIAGTASTDQPVQEIPWIFILIGLIAAIGVALVVFLYKNGYIQIER